MQTEQINYHQAPSRRLLVTSASLCFAFAGGLFLFAFLVESALLFVRALQRSLGPFCDCRRGEAVATVRPRWFETRIVTQRAEWLLTALATDTHH